MRNRALYVTVTIIDFEMTVNNLQPKKEGKRINRHLAVKLYHFCLLNIRIFKIHRYESLFFNFGKINCKNEVPEEREED